MSYCWGVRAAYRGLIPMMGLRCCISDSLARRVPPEHIETAGRRTSAGVSDRTRTAVHAGPTAKRQSQLESKARQGLN